MNVLLVYPEFPDTFWSFKHALKFVRKRSSFPPLGLLTVASLLPRGWAQRLVDLNVRSLSNADLEWADVAMVSGMVVQRDAARRAIARCKQAGLGVVAGGPLFIGEHERFPEVDHFVLDEAELSLPPFLADLAAGRAERFYRSSGFADMRASPAPAWELADLRRYASANIQYSRGCPYDCEFCNVTTLFGHRPRTKSAAQIVDELERLRAAGWRRSVFFVDDNFIGNRKALKNELLPALIDWRERRRGMPFSTEVSINLADDDELVEMMAAAGFNAVFVGIETPDEKSLGECQKHHNRNRDLVADVRRLQRAGMQVQGGFIVGFDNDSPSIFQRQIDFIQSSGIVTAMVGLLQALPGTRLHERMLREGRLVGDATGDNVDGTTNFIPRMNLEVLREGYRTILEQIYSPEHYYERVRTFLREYRRPRFGTLPRMQDLLAGIRSVYHIGIRGEERVHYWKLLAWTLRRRPDLLPLAITLAVYGQHFRKVVELHVI